MSHLHSCKSSNNNDMQQNMSYKQDGVSNPVNDQGNAVRNDGHFDISACRNSQTWGNLMHAMEVSGSETGQRQCVPNQRISNQSPFGGLNPTLKDNLYIKETRYNGPLCSSKVGWEHNNGKSESFTSRKLDSTDSNIVQKKTGNNKYSLKQDQKQVSRDSSTARNHSDGNSYLKLQSIQIPRGFAPIEVRDISGSALRLVQKPDYPSQLENRVSQDGAHKVVGSRPRKRKGATSALPSGIRNRESKSTRASDMLINKGEDVTPIMNDKSSLNRGRKRLILMTQLTQELIPSVPKLYLKSDATMNYQNIVYHVAKSAFGGACTLVSPKDQPLLNLKNEDRNFQEFITQLKEESLLPSCVEDIIKRSETLESDFVRLDERSSVLYVQSWWKELEKITIVNRLINIHGGNSKNTLQRHMIERHVTVFRSQIDTNINALTVPCLSL